MPVLEVHLQEGHHSPDQHTALLARMSAAYATVLDSPVERIRAYLVLHHPEHWTVGGCSGGAPAPYFTAVVLEGRPVEQRHRLLADLTDLLVDVLGVERSRVRGRIIRVDPDDWAIGGVPASAARRDEIAARSRSDAPSGSHVQRQGGPGEGVGLRGEEQRHRPGDLLGGHQPAER
jgi:phenylpyruvate tautomerase PptA (4-oxalocrotonate tautomerase family)